MWLCAACIIRVKSCGYCFSCRTTKNETCVLRCEAKPLSDADDNTVNRHIPRIHYTPTDAYKSTQDGPARPAVNDNHHPLSIATPTTTTLPAKPRRYGSVRLLLHDDVHSTGCGASNHHPLSIATPATTTLPDVEIRQRAPTAARRRPFYRLRCLGAGRGTPCQPPRSRRTTAGASCRQAHTRRRRRRQQTR